MMQKDFNNDIKTAVDVMRKGGVILYPTDTVWGIGCDATNADAVKRIYKIKQRSDHKAMITLVADLAALERTVASVPEVAYELIDCCDRPLTIVYDNGVGVTPELMGDDKTLAVRLTREKFSASLCRALRKPLVSTSANISGQPTPKCFAQISKEILDAVDYVCISRRNESADNNTRPSMVMRLSDDGLFKILRK
jgi:L-threonylcarbamoyladenylate synthase